MKNRALLNIQRKELHDLLVQQGVDPATAVWTNDGKGWTSGNADTLEVGLCHFLFNPDSNGFYSVHIRPGSDGGAPIGNVNLNWSQVKQLFAQWIPHAKAEQEQEDPWLQYSIYIPPEEITAKSNNSAFTHQEAEHLTKALRDFREHLAIQLPSYAEVADRFDPQLERLAQRARQGAGRIDWSNQFMGMLISLCIALSLAPETASSIWKFWLQIVHGLFLT